MVDNRLRALEGDVDSTSTVGFDHGPSGSFKNRRAVQSGFGLKDRNAADSIRGR